MGKPWVGNIFGCCTAKPIPTWWVWVNKWVWVQVRPLTPVGSPMSFPSPIEYFHVNPQNGYYSIFHITLS